MTMPYFVFALALGVLLGFVDRDLTKAEELWSRPIIQSWNYVNVRSDAHMFYWLYYTSHPDGYQRRPWIIWLQGGPGCSSCGFGNFDTIGPLKPDLTSRNTTWIKQASVLFIDSPVGSGFSYVDNSAAYNTEISQVIDDLMEVLRVFLKRIGIFKTRPLYIFGESYGGKIAAYFAQRLHNAIQNGSLSVNLVGVALGNAWISPLDSVLSYADFAYWMSLVDEGGRDFIREKAREVEAAINEGNWTEALEDNYRIQEALAEKTNNVNMYDILNFFTDEISQAEALLERTMEFVKKRDMTMIPENVTWSVINYDVFEKLESVFMKPSISVVDDLLRTTNLQVIVYQGQLDIICNTKGATDWIRKLTWSNLTRYHSANRKAFRNPADNQTAFYVKAFGKFKFYTILGAGHSVPHDKGDAAYRMLDRILNNLDQ